VLLNGLVLMWGPRDDPDGPFDGAPGTPFLWDPAGVKDSAGLDTAYLHALPRDAPGGPSGRQIMPIGADDFVHVLPVPVRPGVA